MTALAVSMLGAVVMAPAAQAAGTPDVQLTLSSPARALQGAPFDVTLSASNPGGPDGYNASFRLVLPAGASLVSSTPSDVVPKNYPQADSSTVLVWSNVTDLLTGATSTVTATVSPGTLPLGAVPFTGGAYVNSDPRLVPTFTGLGAPLGQATGSGTGASSTHLVPFTITKATVAPEAELIRGAHDHRTLVSLRIDNNFRAPSNGFSIVDYIPAGLEFLGCGVAGNDNSAAREYPGAPALNAGSFALPGDCPTASSVDTTMVDPDGAGPRPSALYTVVTWDAASLAMVGAGALGISGAGRTHTIYYVVGIPQRANALFIGTVPSAAGGLQGSNLDNNTGPSTLETDTEQAATNVANLSGTYTGTGAGVYGDISSSTVTLEDLAIRKSASVSSLAQGALTTWTLQVETSEYTATAGNLVITDTVPDGLRVDATNPTATSVTVDPASGKTIVIWSGADLPDLTTNGTRTLTMTTTTLASYRATGRPVLANDAWTNGVAIDGTATEVVNGVTQAPRAVHDVSNASQTAAPISLTKDVAAPVAGACGDGTTLSPWETTSSTHFTPGDLVCWRVSFQTPANLDSTSVLLGDFLPAGFTYVSSTSPATSYVDFTPATGAQPTVTGAAATGSALAWMFGGVGASLAKDSVATVVLTTRITDADAAANGDILGNLAKLSYKNTAGTTFQLRAQANAPWVEPILGLTKAATGVAGASTGSLRGGDQVDYTVTVKNTGGIAADHVAVRDVLPSQLACADVVSITTAGISCTNGPSVLTGTLPTVAAGGGTATLTYRVRIPHTLAPGTVLTNTAHVDSYDVATNDPANPTFPYTSTLQAARSVTVRAVSLTKNAASPVEVGNASNQATIGEIVTYTLVATIPANTTSYDATIVDVLPAGMAYVSTTSAGCTAPVGCALTPQEITPSGQTRGWFLGDPAVNAADQVVTIVYTAQVRDVVANAAGATKINGARLAINDADVLTTTPALPPNTGTFTRRTGNQTTTTTIVEPNLGVTKADSDADHVATPGETIPFTVTVTNAGTNASPRWTSAAKDVAVVDTIPVLMSLLDAGGNPLTADGVVPPFGGLWNNAARTITWNSTTTPALSSVAPGTTVPLTYQVRVTSPVTAPSTFTNRVTVVTSSLAGPSADERFGTAGAVTRYAATAQDTLSGPRPYVTKSVRPGSATIGQEVTYTVVASIPPSVETYDATVLDTLPTGLSFVPGSTTSSCAPAAGCAGLTASELTPNGQKLGWFLGDLPANAAQRDVTITYRAVVTDIAGNVNTVPRVNSAAMGSNATDKVGPGGPGTTPAPGTFDGVSGPSTATVTIVEPRLVLTKTVASAGGPTHLRRVVPGETVTYTITLRNNLTSAAHDVAVADTTDPRYASITSVTGATVTDADPSGDGKLAFTVADIAAGATVTITYQAVAPDPLAADPTGAELTNTAVSTYSSLSGTVPGERSYTSNTDTVGLEGDVASIGDTVWFDTNGNGVKDGVESGVAGVTVTVTYLGPDNSFGTADDEPHTTTTAIDGTYLVKDLPQGEYRVAISGVPAGTVNTFDEDTSPVSLDGISSLTLADGDAHLNADFGIRGSGTVGDTVWLDRDGNGVKDPGEPGVGGVKVTVSWPATSGQPANSVDTITAADGTYAVTGIPAADVTVTVDRTSFPAGTVLASEPHGGAVDGTATVALAAGATDNGVDFGLRGIGQIGHRVWVDTNRDGVQDPGEPGIPGATVDVRWYGQDGNPGTADDLVVTTTTGADGAYLVGGLPAGAHSVTVTALPTALAPTYDEDNGIVSPNSATVLSLPVGGSHLTADFGFVADTSVGDRVWLDTNGDGVQDADEPGIPSVMITVTSAGVDGTLGSADDIVRTTTTAADGSWLVTGLPAGPTRVAVTSGLPGGVTQTFDADGTTTADVSEVTLVDGTTDLAQDFGYTGASSIGDRVWVDANADGAQDAGEPGLPGVAVEVTWLGPDGVLGGGDDVVLSATTATDGSYLVGGLPHGDYSVQVGAGVPAGYTPSHDETGAADGSSSVGGLGAGGPEAHLTADFGYAGTGAISGTIWLDRVVDGTLDTPTEAGLPGIAIDVTWAGPDGLFGTADDVVTRTVTGAGGAWSLEHMPRGPFTTVVDTTTIPAGTQVVWDREHGTTGPTGAYGGTLAPGEVRTGIDTAVRGAGSIGDLIWVDANRDGLRPPTEPVAPDVRVVVTWLGADGVLGGGDDVSVEVRTNAKGIYVADGLPAGRYVVTFDKATFPKGTAAFADLDGGDPLVTTVSLTTGQGRTDVDLVLRPASLAATGAAVGGIALLALLLLGGGLVLRRRAGVLAAAME